MTWLLLLGAGAAGLEAARPGFWRGIADRLRGVRAGLGALTEADVRRAKLTYQYAERSAAQARACLADASKKEVARSIMGAIVAIVGTIAAGSPKAGKTAAVAAVELSRLIPQASCKPALADLKLNLERVAAMEQELGLPPWSNKEIDELWARIQLARLPR